MRVHQSTHIPEYMPFEMINKKTHKTIKKEKKKKRDEEKKERNTKRTGDFSSSTSRECSHTAKTTLRKKFDDKHIKMAIHAEENPLN